MYKEKEKEIFNVEYVNPCQSCLRKCMLHTILSLSIHPSCNPLTPGQVRGGTSADPSMHWAKGRNTTWTGPQFLEGPTHLFTHLYLWAIWTTLSKHNNNK